MTKDELNDYIKEYLKANLSIDVNSNSSCGDFGYGEYRNYMSHEIIVSLGDEVIAKTNFDTGTS